MKSVIKISKSVDDAVEAAIEELGVNRSEIEVEVLEEPNKGFLGLIGVKDATVKVSVVDNSKELAEEFLTDMLTHMGIEGNFTIEKKSTGLYIDIDGVSPSDMGIVIGKRGNTLDSIQYLLSLYVNKNTSNYIRVFLDAQGYRDKREKTLKNLAKNMAKKTIRTRKPVKLEPMNPYERRIIHSALQDEKKVKTYSEGEEPYRRIVIKER